jgi:predicted alpha/beta superfamily hydrolase
VLWIGEEMVWAQGNNVLALADGGSLVDVYPHFRSDPECSVCELKQLEDDEGRQHAYRVFYPPGYSENTLRRYPVVYMQDGQNLFFRKEAFQGHHWRVTETLHLLTAMNALKPVIVVGVYPKDRMEDYTRPGYARYGRFLVEALKPEIDARYRTLLGPEQNAVMGSSLGGVVSFYLAWEHCGTFGMAACMSSTFGYRDNLRERVTSEPKRPLRLYLDSGWPRDNYEVTRDMRALLVRCGFEEGSDLQYLAFPEALHNEASWALRAHLPFQFLFGRRLAQPAGSPTVEASRSSDYFLG